MVKLCKYLGLTLAGIILLAALLFYLLVYPVFYQNLHVSGQQKSLVLMVHAGDSSRNIADYLLQQDVITHRLPFLFTARLLRLDRSMQAGEYRILPTETAYQLMQQIHAGQVIQYSFRIAEGSTFADVRAALSQQSKLTHLLQGHDSAWLMQQLQSQHSDPTGLLFPDSYHFTAGSTDLALLKRAYQRMQKIILHEWSQRAANLPYDNPYQAIILASLIETEAAVDSERALIASVLINRLRINMRLQVDPTVMYGLGLAYGSKLTRSAIKIDTAYNTYKHTGLPPTPIAFPSLSSLQAALHPAKTDYLYYVAKKNGHHAFSKTYSQHQQAIEKYLKLPAKADKAAAD